MGEASYNATNNRHEGEDDLRKSWEVLETKYNGSKIIDMVLEDIQC